MNQRNLLFSLLLFVSSILFCFTSCRKTEFRVENSLHEFNFQEKFFAVKSPLNERTSLAIEKLKAENERTGFVNKLPKYSGLPLWEKTIVTTQPANAEDNYTANPPARGPSAAFPEEGDSSTNIIIPLTSNNSNLSSIIVATSMGDTFAINCYTTNDYLYSLAHGNNTDTTHAKNALTFFFYMEHHTFGNTDFYNIPANLFGSTSAIEADSSKTIKIAGISEILPTSAGIQWICTENIGMGYNLCPTCHLVSCPLTTTYTYTYTVCIPVPTGEGGGCTWCPPPPPPGGGGGGTGGGNPPPCPSSATGWYIFNPVNEGCNVPPPPPPPPDTLLKPCLHATTLAANQSFKNMMQDLKNHSNNPNDITEHGWIYEHDTNGNLLQDSITGVPGKKEIDFDYTGKLDGVAHNHFANSLSIFSPDDLWSLCTIFNDGNVKDSTKFTLPLVTASGTQYILMIENLTKFRPWAKKFTQGNFKMFKNFYTKGCKIKESNSIAENEKKFLQYMKQNGGAGLKLFRGNSTFTEWTPIGLDPNNNVITVPCL